MNGLGLTLKNGGSKSSNNHILHQNSFVHVEFDRRNIVNPIMLLVYFITQSSAQFDKGVNNLSLVTRDLNKNSEHVDKQVVLTHEKEFIVTMEIAGKEITPNTPTWLFRIKRWLKTI
ncbi:hypothetical protein H5410_037271 [Solanum commersonii]|uniref:Uncharacterized protein n=1 Tax=Solanum commersonii TaxID=4109 RepID=A0A9J5Y804_SOLCO|nr:hypothetical protein H5410_037271 [Solanum commersonii]